MPGAPYGIERFLPSRIENADESKSADDQQRPLQDFRARHVDAKVIEQRQIRERP